jgi:hypothetical protein
MTLDQNLLQPVWDGTLDSAGFNTLLDLMPARQPDTLDWHDAILVEDALQAAVERRSLSVTLALLDLMEERLPDHAVDIVESTNGEEHWAWPVYARLVDPWGAEIEGPYGLCDLFAAPATEQAAFLWEQLQEGLS